MADRIQLLTDNIANQIAAGEVIQRPASAVKELLENAVDAGATQIKLIIQDAGKALIQVIDNGSGMSETDARMCFERHATSKIRSIDDLFHIRTMGFRGEALASIAAVAQVELRTKRASDETGTCIEIENSAVKRQHPVAMNTGTSICMKNLFFNVPARRNFLRSNAAEMRHIVDEFIRVAMAFPEIFFSLTSNGQDVFHLDSGSPKQRILQLLGQHYNSKLVTVKEETDYLNIRGFVGKPEAAKKTRGDQYFFVNNRFIRSPYLNHAIMQAYQDMIPADSFPMYVLFIDLDPVQVDVNVHPTKQEIKFEDEKIVYAFIQAAVKHALAQFSITPTLDFDLDQSIQQLDSVQKPFTESVRSAAHSTSIFKTFTEANQAHKIDPLEQLESTGADEPGTFQSLGRYFKEEDIRSEVPTAPAYESAEEAVLAQLYHTYILYPTAESLLLIHQQLAHERINYERLREAVSGSQVPSQRSLFPLTLELTPPDAVLLRELLPELLKMGYQVEAFGGSSFVLQGTPADLEAGREKSIIENILEQYKFFSHELKSSGREALLRTVASQQSIRPGTVLSQKEMQHLVTSLFRCSSPNTSPSGRPTYTEIKKDQLEKIFSKG